MRILVAFVLILSGGWLIWRQASSLSGDAAMIAAHDGNLHALQRIKSGEINAPPRSDQVPLIYYAVWGERPEAVRLLLDRGADADAAWCEFTPLGVAAGTSEPALVRVLLDADADPEAGCPAGWTPLMVAVARGDADTARLLVEAGADASAVNNAGYTAADFARRHASEELLAVLAAETIADRPAH